MLAEQQKASLYDAIEFITIQQHKLQPPKCALQWINTSLKPFQWKLINRGFTKTGFIAEVHLF